MRNHRKLEMTKVRRLFLARAGLALILINGLLLWAVPSAQADAPGTWTATGSLNTARSNYAIARLPNGKVLIAGGLTGGTLIANVRSGFTVLASAELFDPATGQFTATGNLNIARTMCQQISCSYNDNAVVLPNGKVLIVGGVDASGTRLASAELFDPSANNGVGAFTLLGPSMNDAREGATMTLLSNGKVLIAGGSGPAGGPSGALNTAELFDPAANTFNFTAGSMGPARDHHTATLLPNGNVLLAGGCSTTNCGPSLLGNTRLYDPASETFGSPTTMLMPRAVHTATLLPTGKVLFAGGVDTNGNALSASELFDPGSAGPGTFIPTGSMATARADHAAILLPNGKVLVATGSNNFGATDLNSAELYDPGANGGVGAFTNTGTMVSVRRFQNRLVLLGNGKVLISGGNNSANGNTDLVSAELYCPEMPGTPDTFVSTGSMGTPRDTGAQNGFNDAHVLATGKVLFAAGQTNGGGTTIAELYDPAAGTFAPTGPMATARYGAASTLLPTGNVLYTGGVSGGPSFASAELYDPNTGTFGPTGPMVAGRFVHGQILLPNGKVLVYGGSDGANTANCPTPSAELYDPVSGTFTTTGAMVTCHSTPGSATLLPTGKVLIAGGTLGASGGFARLSEAELYDPTTGTFTVTGPMTIPRNAHTATLLPTGKVLIAGGDTGPANGTVTASAELYDPATGTFTATGSMATALEAHSAVLLPTGKVLIVGGQLGASSGFARLSEAELYDPATGTFISTGSMGTARTSFFSALLPTGRVLTAGGQQAGGVFLSSAELFSTTICGPEIGSISQTSALVGSALTITGTHFGATQDASTVRFGGTTATILSWSDTQIIAIVPIGRGPTPVVVTVNGTATNGPTLTVVASLTSISVSPSNPTLTAGQTQQFTATGTFSDGSQQVLTSGPPLGVAFFAGTNRLVIVDPATGSLLPIGAGFPASISSAGVSALDTFTHHYIVSMAGGLFSIDTFSGAVLFSPVSAGLSSLEFDSSTGTLFGIASIAGTNTLVVVNPLTGALTPRGSGLPGPTGVSAGMSALDGAGHRYFVTAAGNLFTVNTQTGAASSTPFFFPPATPFPGVSSMEFDPGLNKLFGIALIAGTNRLVEINPTTGTLTTVGSSSLPGPSGVSAGISALDAATHRYFVSAGGTLVVLDTQSGNILSTTPFPGVSSLQIVPLWSSSNTGVATINQSGLATGVNQGTTTITATAGNIMANTPPINVSQPPPPVAVSLDVRILAGIGITTFAIHTIPSDTVVFSNLSTTSVQNLSISPGTYQLQGGGKSLNFTVAGACNLTIQ